MASNLEGNLCIYQIEQSSRNMRKIPIFSLNDTPELRIADFDPISDSVIATLTAKKIRLYDTLLPYNGRCSVLNEFKMAKSGGNIIRVNRRT